MGGIASSPCVHAANVTLHVNALPATKLSQGSGQLCEEGMPDKCGCCFPGVAVADCIVDPQVWEEGAGQ